MCQSRSLGDTGQHPWTYLFVVVEGENKIRPAWPGKNSVGSAVMPFNHPSDLQKPRKNAFGTGAGPLAHAASKVMFNRSGPASPCSMRSASTRNARA